MRYTIIAYNNNRSRNAAHAHTDQNIINPRVYSCNLWLSHWGGDTDVSVEVGRKN